LRAEEDAILVGKNTALYDNPSLNVRSWVGNNPLRILIDRNLSLGTDLSLYDQSIPTLIYNCQKNEQQRQLEYVKLEEGDFIKSLVKDLGQRKVQSLIVEGGATIINAFIDAGLWDEARVFSSETIFGEGVKAPQLQGYLASETDVMGDRLRVYQK
jgi:diaminohydroxyphosphoribosylaminopyrimidine deaminase/5-amino-6-(5-phosphoribosylamino)uracil reductase